MRRRRRDDGGSMLPLVIGLVVIVVALVAVVTDAGALWLARRSLQSTVDGAALAGAQAVDLGAVYAGGATGDLALEPAAVRRAVRAYARAVPSSSQLARFRITSIAVAGPEVTVAARTVVPLPFTTYLTGRGVPVNADASAVLRVPG